MMYYWTIISNVLAVYAFLHIVVNKYIVRKHKNKLVHFPIVISGGSPHTWNLEQEAIAYSKTRWAKAVEILIKIF